MEIFFFFKCLSAPTRRRYNTGRMRRLRSIPRRRMLRNILIRRRPRDCLSASPIGVTVTQEREGKKLLSIVEKLAFMQSTLSCHNPTQPWYASRLGNALMRDFALNCEHSRAKIKLQSIDRSGVARTRVLRKSQREGEKERPPLYGQSLLRYARARRVYNLGSRKEAKKKHNNK